MSEITGKTQVIGVWGHPVSHSRSPAMHNAALAALGMDWVYVPFDIDPDPINVEYAVASIRALGLVGVNVTVPLKEAVLPYTIVSEEALRIGSVNTIHNRDGKLYGYSTDGPGFLRALADAGQQTSGREVLLLGAGGSARAVGFALAAQNCHVKIANRTENRAKMLAHDISQNYSGATTVAEWGKDCGAFDLIVNTTSLGMHPNEEAMPELPPAAFGTRPFVFDLIYAPCQTKLLTTAEQAGCGTMNGVKMLAHQGALSLAIWTGLPPEKIPVSVMEDAILGSL